MNVRFLFALLSVAISISGCATIGPKHEPPQLNLPVSFSEAGMTWHKRSPDSLSLPKEWWSLYQDTTLDRLVGQALDRNNELIRAAARVKRARSMSEAVRGRLFPTINVNPSVRRSKDREDQAPMTSFSVPADLSYEVDIWGVVRRQVESASASADAEQELLNASRLTVAGEVTQTYWALRAVDADRALITKAVELRQQALGMLRRRREAGTISGLDLSRAEGEVATAKADKFQLDQDRVALLNTLAVLVGVPATEFALPERIELPSPPSIPVSVPSELLRQRPDIRAAERRVAAANADIGVAMGAYYPSFRIGGSGGFSSALASELLKSSSLIWSIGPNVSIPLLQQKFLRHQRDAAIAAHEAASAEYRQIVLVSIREVENALQASSIIVSRLKVQQEAVAAARKTSTLSSERFRTGLVSFLDVVDAERTRLEAERRLNAIRAERLALSVALARSMGGSW